METIFEIYNVITAIIIGIVLAAFFYFIFGYFLFEFLPMKIAAGEPIFLKLLQDPQSVMNSLNSNMTLVPTDELEDPSITELRAQTLDDIAKKERRRKLISIWFAGISEIILFHKIASGGILGFLSSLIVLFQDFHIFSAFWISFFVSLILLAGATYGLLKFTRFLTSAM